MNIVDERNEKEKKFEKGLIGFFKEYYLALENPIDFERHSHNCGNQARTISEILCRYIILNSNEPDGRKKYDVEQRGLNKLLETVTRSKDPIIIDQNEREDLKIKLLRIKDFGNQLSHEINFKVTRFDLDELRNYLSFLTQYTFGDKFLKNIILNTSPNNSNSTIDSSLSSIEEATITINLGKDTKLKNSVNNIKNSIIKIG